MGSINRYTRNLPENMLLLKILPYFPVSGGFIIFEKPELTLVPVCSQTTTLSPQHSEQGGTVGHFHLGSGRVVRRRTPHTGSSCQSVCPRAESVTFHTGSASGRSRVLLPGIRDSPEASKWTFYFRICCLYSPHLHRHGVQNCVCGAWGMFRDAKSTLF